jgi:hypothetical protein
MTSCRVSQANLQENFPTDHLPREFWENLGRAVATFGYLEKVLGKAIFVFIGTRHHSTPEELESQLDILYQKLEIALTGQLGALIDTYESAVKSHQDNPIRNLDVLLYDLRKAAKLRNVLCHGSWGYPDSNGASLPYFINKKIEKAVTPMSSDDLAKTQLHVAGLACAVIDSVTGMGFQFPGLSGPGRPLLDAS